MELFDNLLMGLSTALQLKNLLFWVVLIVVGLLVGPGGVSIFG